MELASFRVYYRGMKWIKVRYNEDALPELEKLDRQGAIQILVCSETNEEGVYIPKRLGFLDRSKDVVWGQRLERPLQSILGGLSDETAQEMMRRNEDGWGGWKT